MASRLNLARLGAAVLGASVALVLSAALPASAGPAPHNDPGPRPNKDFDAGTLIVMDYTDDQGKAVEKEVNPGLIGLTLPNGDKLEMYCLQLNVSLKYLDMKQVPWDSFPDNASGFNSHNKQINWILHNSVPQITDLSALSKAAGLKDTISRQDAIAATQAAIWNLTDGATITQAADEQQGVHGNIANADINGLFAYLTGKANVGMDQPTDKPVDTPALTVSPGNTDKTPLAGKAGTKIGPFTVSTNLSGVTLTDSLPKGVTLVDDNGATLDPAKVADGTKVYFNVPANQPSGEASFTMSTPATIGELFVGTTDGKSSGPAQFQGARANCSPDMLNQSLIVASTSASASAAVTWAANVVTSTTPSTTPTTPGTKPSTPSESTTSAPAVAVPTTSSSTGGGSNLPFTGVSLIVPLGLAIVLIGGGVTFLVLQRRKRAAQQ